MTLIEGISTHLKIPFSIRVKSVSFIQSVSHHLKN